MEPHKTLGAQGEDFAADYLQQKGLVVKARNVHAQGGELDIVAFDPLKKIYLLIEVKTRTNEAFMLGVEAVGLRKQQKMCKAAAHYFLNVLKLAEVPCFQIHAIILTPSSKNRGSDEAFLVEYYDDLS